MLSPKIGLKKDFDPKRQSPSLIINESLKLADEKIQEKWHSLGGAPGLPKIPGRAGLIAAGKGFYREYVTGSRIYYSEQGTVQVYGAIGEKYNQLGGPDSWLGWPLSDENDIVNGGRALKFEHGGIYWWPDTGAIELGNVKVSYTGMYCFSETNYDQSSNSDEPYAILGVVVPQESDAKTIRTAIYEDVDSGDSRPDNIELYSGPPTGLQLSVLLLEHDDENNPDKYKETVRLAVEQASKGVALAVGQIPYVGSFLAPVVEAALKAVGPDITDAVNDALDLKDDKIDFKNFLLSGKDIVRFARTPAQNFWGIQWHMDSPLLSGNGADYKVYFEITAV